MREVEGAEKQAMVAGINIEILDILGVHDKVREVEGAEKQAMVARELIQRSWTSLESMTR